MDNPNCSSAASEVNSVRACLWLGILLKYSVSELDPALVQDAWADLDAAAFLKKAYEIVGRTSSASKDVAAQFTA